MVVAEVTAGWRGGAREWGGERALEAGQLRVRDACKIPEVCVSRTYPPPHGTMSRESRPVPQESSLPPGGALNASLSPSSLSPCRAEFLAPVLTVPAVAVAVPGLSCGPQGAPSG